MSSLILSTLLFAMAGPAVVPPIANPPKSQSQSLPGGTVKKDLTGQHDEIHGTDKVGKKVDIQVDPVGVQPVMQQ